MGDKKLTGSGRGAGNSLDEAVVIGLSKALGKIAEDPMANIPEAVRSDWKRAGAAASVVDITNELMNNASLSYAQRRTLRNNYSTLYPSVTQEQINKVLGDAGPPPKPNYSVSVSELNGLDRLSEEINKPTSKKKISQINNESNKDTMSDATSVVKDWRDTRGGSSSGKAAAEKKAEAQRQKDTYAENGPSNRDGNGGRTNSSGNSGASNTGNNPGNPNAAGYNGGGGNKNDRSSSSSSGSGGGGTRRGGQMPPVVIDMDGNGVSLQQVDQSMTHFDVDDDGYKEKTAWTAGNDGFLVYDIGDDNKITQSKELAIAKWTEDEGDTDLQALATQFDSNHDGIFDANDAEFDKFKIWQDRNFNGEADEGEMVTLDEAGIRSINLKTKENTRKTLADGTIIYGLVDVEKTDGAIITGADVALAYNEAGYRTYEDENGNIVYEFENGESVKTKVLAGDELDFDLGEDITLIAVAKG